MTGAELAKAIVLSPEFKNRNVGNEEFVTILYGAFFDRSPDEAGKAAWVDALESGTSREDVLDGFIYAQEFWDLCKLYGITEY